MHDVISKTLPTSEAELQRRAILELAEADLRIQDAQMQDSAMIEADLARGVTKPAPAAKDPLVAAVSDAIQYLRDTMFECALSEVQNAGRFDPDYARADDAEAELLKAIDALLAGRAAPAAPAVSASTCSSDNGLLTSHNPDRRLL